MPAQAVREMAHRNRIAEWHFENLVRAAKAAGFTEVTYRLLASFQQGLGPDGQPLPPKRAT